jgi:hypothetical protein
MLAQANQSFHSLKSIGSNFAGTRSAPSSGTGTPTTTEGEDWDEKWITRERERAREKRKKDEKRRQKKREAFVSGLRLSSVST